jgi:YbbR domain-containing protein
VHFLTENLALKAVSLALAVGLWFVIAGDTTSEIGLGVPLELRNFPAQLELTGDPVNSVEVRLRASPGIIHGLGPGDVSAQIDLTGTGEGERIVHMTADSIRVPFGVTVVKISPAILTLKFERTMQKTVPIRPRLAGTPGEGFEAAEPTSQPAEIQIAGPRSRVEQVESAFTEPVSVEGARTAIVADRNIGLQDPLLRLLGNPRVRVTVPIREVQETRTLDGLAISVRGGDAIVYPQTVRIVVEGPASAVRRLSATDLKPYVDATNLEAAGSLPVAIEILPGHVGVKIQATEPAAVRARPAARKKG